MEENKNKRENENGEEVQSNAARRIRALDEDAYKAEPDEPLEINKWENFWYHNKVKVIMIAAFSFIIGVAMLQFVRHSNPDVSIIYSGPEYITPNENQSFCDILEGLADDYDGDGRKYVQLNDIVFMTEEQIAEFERITEEAGDKGAVDRLSNKQTSERFTYEIFGAEASVCLLARGQYDMVKAEGGFLPLSEIFDEIPEGAVDEYGVLFADTKLCKFYDAAQIFPEDTVIALRRVSTMSALTGRQKAEKLHARSMDLFKKILGYEYPAGYVPTEETADGE